MARQAGGRKSLLFVNKKKQKNLFHLAPGSRASRLQTDKVFLLPFFQKKKILAFLPRAFPRQMRRTV
jgi:hypothetical protein